MRLLFFLMIGISSVLVAQIPQYNVEMAASDYQLLFNRDIFSDSLIPASFEFQGSSWDDAQIRFKGHSTRYYPKKSYRIKFNKNNLFQNMQSINFNAMYTDKSFIREKLAWDMFSELNQLAPHAHHASFSINGKEGLFLFIEKVDKYLLQNRGRKIAPMYEANDTYIGADLTVQPDSILKMYYDKEIGNATDYSDLAQLITAINSVPDESFRDTVYKYFDVSSILNWFTGNILTMMGDSYNKNYLLYRDTLKVNQQWTIIPWDYDLSFGRSGDLAISYPASLLNDGFAYSFEPLAGPSNVLKDRFMANPALWEELRLHVDSSLNTIFTEERLYPRIDSLKLLIENYVSLDQQKWGTTQDFYDHVETLKYFVTARRNYLKKTFINPPNGEYNRVTLPISQLNVPYHFVAYDGRQLATLWFSEFQGLDSILVQVHPESIPPDIANPGDERFVKRWIEIISYPPSAQFTAKLQWMYSDVSSLDREVGNGVQDERLLRCYEYDGVAWKCLSSKVNYFGNFVTVDSINETYCGTGKYFTLMLPEAYMQKWFRQPLNYWQKWYDVQFADSLNGFIVGEQGTILKTIDGGVSWIERNVGMSLPLTSIGITSLNNIFVGGENGFLFHSVDTGKSWSQVTLTQNKNISGIMFESQQFGWLYGDSSLLMKTTDGGMVWTTSNIDSVKNIVGISKIDSNRIVFTYQDGSFAATTNGGLAWQTGSISSNKILLKAETDGLAIWAVGENGAVVRYSFITETSKDLSVSANITLRDIIFLGSECIYVAGDGGKIFYSTNSGIDWYSQYSADSHDLYGVAFTNNTHGLAIGNAGTILTTSADGSVTTVKNNIANLPSEIRLYQNYPNPFNPITDIRYQILDISHVALKVYDILGREIALLVNEIQGAGIKSVKWDASASGGLSSGIYFYSLTIIGDKGSMFHDVKKLVLLK
jgi:spore coat protein H